MGSRVTSRQTFPLWSLRTLPTERPAAPPRSATIIALPTGPARQRRVLTYPAAIEVPARMQNASPIAERPLAPLALIALAGPTALLGTAMALFQMLA